jgi:hypothetical protein
MSSGSNRKDACEVSGAIARKPRRSSVSMEFGLELAGNATGPGRSRGDKRIVRVFGPYKTKNPHAEENLRDHRRMAAWTTAVRAA